MSRWWNEVGGNVARRGQKVEPACLNDTQVEPLKCRKNREKLAAPQRNLGVK